MTERIAVITGAGQGMGRAIALRLAADEIKTVLVGRTRSKLEQVASEIAAIGEGVPSAMIVPMDVTNTAQIEVLKASLSQVDMLINCAGEALIAPIEETSEADWDRLMAVNCKAPFMMAKALLPLLKQSQNASIINISSKVALVSHGTVSAYTAAKTGLLGLSRSLAAELREDEIRVVALCPGATDTPMRWQSTPHYDRKVVIDVSIIAETVCSLVSLPRGVTTGEILIQSVHYD